MYRTLCHNHYIDVHGKNIVPTGFVLILMESSLPMNIDCQLAVWLWLQSSCYPILLEKTSNLLTTSLLMKVDYCSHF